MPSSAATSPDDARTAHVDIDPATAHEVRITVHTDKGAEYVFTVPTATLVPIGKAS